MRKEALMTLMLALTLAGCGKNNAEPVDTTEMTQIETESESDTEDTVGNEETDASEETKESNESEEKSLTVKERPEIEEDNIDNIQSSAKVVDKTYNDTKQNVMFSPLSANMALGMLSEGADGVTKYELCSYLDILDYSTIAEKYAKQQDTENKDTSGIMSLVGDGSETLGTLKVNNSMWIDNTLNVNNDYKTKLTESYGAKIEEVDFKNNTSEIVSNINGWVDETTNGLIKDIINNDSISEATKSILVNTVYIKAMWNDPFSKDYKGTTFTKLDSTQKDADFIEGSADIYYENDKAVAFGKSYANNLEFIGILPKQEGDFNIESLDILELLKNGSKDRDVIATMPKLEFETNISNLKTYLSDCGLTDALCTDADYSGIADGIYVDNIVQKTKIKLDENGTEAAAATAAMVNVTSMIEPKETVEVTLNRPFAFVIYDDTNNQIVFMGKVVEP